MEGLGDDFDMEGLGDDFDMEGLGDDIDMEGLGEDFDMEGLGDEYNLRDCTSIQVDDLDTICWATRTISMMPRLNRAVDRRMSVPDIITKVPPTSLRSRSRPPSRQNTDPQIQVDDFDTISLGSD